MTSSVVSEMTSSDARRARRRAKLSQREVGEAIGLSEAAYQAWEAGRRALPWERTPADVFEAIRRLAAEREEEQP